MSAYIRTYGECSKCGWTKFRPSCTRCIPSSVRKEIELSQISESKALAEAERLLGLRRPLTTDKYGRPLTVAFTGRNK